MTHDDEQRQLAAARDDLVREFAGRVEAEDVQRRFARVVAGFDGAPIRTFVPVIAQRIARQDLVSRA